MKFNISNLKLNKSTWYLISGMILWAIYWGYTTYTFVLTKRTKSVEWFNKDCKDLIERCAEINAAELSRTMSYEIQVIFWQIAFSLIVFWCFFVTFKYLFKFIKVGFLNEFKWADLSFLKKTLMVLLGGFNVLVILILYSALNESEKSKQISVVPGSFFVHKYPENNPSYVSAQGTWNNLDKYPMNSIDSMFYKIQTSEIKCHKSDNTCYEAIATAYKNNMQVEVFEHPIINWTNDSVTFGEDGICRKDLNTINFATKSVSRSFEYLPAAGCDKSNKNEYSQMVEGYDVYLEEREKLDSLITKLIKFVLNIREENDL